MSLKFIDLFCGLGGFRIALESFGLECVFSSDIDLYVQKNYKYNFNDNIHGDITNININDIPNHDILCAGFPCQPFSIANKKINGFEHTKGTLFHNIIKIAEKHNPKCVFMENVANLEKHDQGRTLNIIIKSFREIGYYVYHKVLNSADYGTPQKRKRIYLIAIKKTIIKAFNFPDPIKNYNFLLDYIDQNNKDEKLLVKRKCFIYKQVNDDERFNDIKRIGLIENNEKQGYRIYSPNGLSITFTANGGGIAGKTGAYLIDDIVRKLSIDECLRILGYPDNYHFHNDISNVQRYKMIGNSVSIDTLKHITKEILKVIL